MWCLIVADKRLPRNLAEVVAWARGMGGRFIPSNCIIVPWGSFTAGSSLDLRWRHLRGVEGWSFFVADHLAFSDMPPAPDVDAFRRQWDWDCDPLSLLITADWLEDGHGPTDGLVWAERLRRIVAAMPDTNTNG